MLSNLKPRGLLDGVQHHIVLCANQTKANKQNQIVVARY